MTFPHEKEIQEVILKVLVDLGGEARPRDVYPRVTAMFPQLTPDDLSRTLPSGSNTWTNRIQFARQRLVEEKRVDKSTVGVWRVTHEGRQRIEAKSQQPLQQVSHSAARPPIEGGQPLSPLVSHSQLVERVAEIGRILGKSVGVEEGPVYKHDVAWKDNQFANPNLVIEICDKGNLDKDIASLTWAVRNWRAKGVLVVVNEGDFISAKRKLGSEDSICLVKADSLLQVYSLVKGDSLEAIRAMFGS